MLDRINHGKPSSASAASSIAITPFEAVSRIGLGQKFESIKDKIDFSRGFSVHEFQSIVSGAIVFAIAVDSPLESELQKLVDFVDAAVRKLDCVGTVGS